MRPASGAVRPRRSTFVAVVVLPAPAALATSVVSVNVMVLFSNPKAKSVEWGSATQDHAYGSGTAHTTRLGLGLTRPSVRSPQTLGPNTGGYGPAVPAAAAAVAALRADPSRTVVVTDFDGTLSPIVEDPAAARPLPGVVDTLHGLAARFARVAVVSGRPVAFLRDRLELDHRPPTSLFVSGLYGIEWMADGEERVHETALAFRPVVADVADRTEAAAPAGVHVERKGYSVTVHVRNAPPAADDWARSWSDEVASATGLVVHGGRRSYELRPPLDLDKGTVIDGLLAGAGAACFLGDDLGDLPAFDALDRLRDATGAATVRVGVRSGEAPPVLLERADVVVDGPAGSLELLRALL